MRPLLSIAAKVPETEAEGPGKRFAVWVQGCYFRCPGCCNPQYLEFGASSEPMTAEALATEILQRKEVIEGVTFVGGEPFAQAAGLAEVSSLVKAAGLSVMVFTGFTREQLEDSTAPEYTSRRAFLDEIDLLIDGPYLREQHDTKRRWIGSANQRIHFLSDRYQHLAPDNEGWPAEGNTLELRFRDGQLFINGFPHLAITKASRALRRKET